MTSDASGAAARYGAGSVGGTCGAHDVRWVVGPRGVAVQIAVDRHTTHLEGDDRLIAGHDGRIATLAVLGCTLLPGLQRRCGRRIIRIRWAHLADDRAFVLEKALEGIVEIHQQVEAIGDLLRSRCTARHHQRSDRCGCG